MPVNPKILGKKRGDTILSDDWNLGFAEVGRLDRDKLNTAGGTISGGLTVAGAVKAQSLEVTDTAKFKAASVDSAALQLYQTPLVINDATTLNVRVAVERYKVDTVGPPLPPPGIPAFLRINATSPPTTVEIVGERVATIDTIFGPYVERSIYLKHSNPNATIYATVFSASPPSAFKPYYVNGLNLDQLAPLYRLVLPSNGFTYYTTWPKDKDNALEGGWKYNGIACWVFIGPQPGTTPLYRLYNTFGEHFIT